MNNIFDTIPNKIPVIIVYDKETIEYATFLQQLISQNNNTEENNTDTASIQKVHIDATIWSTKVYEDNLPKLTSNTHIIFIGSSQVAKDHGRNVHFIYGKYGMYYGWLGKRAVLYIDSKKLFRKKEYDGFIALCNEYAKKLKKTNVNFENTLSTKERWIEVLCKSTDYWTPIVYRIIASKNRIIKDQQFRCLILLFYMNGLQKFLEE